MRAGHERKLATSVLSFFFFFSHCRNGCTTCPWPSVHDNMVCDAVTCDGLCCYTSTRCTISWNWVVIQVLHNWWDSSVTKVPPLQGHRLLPLPQFQVSAPRSQGREAADLANHCIHIPILLRLLGGGAFSLEVSGLATCSLLGGQNMKNPENAQTFSATLPMICRLSD